MANGLCTHREQGTFPTYIRRRIGGGNAIQVGPYKGRHPVISPDRKFIACQVPDPNTQNWSVAVLRFDREGEPRLLATVEPPFRWSPSGNSLITTVTDSLVSTL